MKRLGFLTGAVLGAIAVWAFYTLRHVDDDDRLSLVLAEHCLPYVKTGDAPFQDLGRAPGVYDDVDLRDAVADGGARILFDGRFTAQWGVLTGAGRNSRICEIVPVAGPANPPAFDVDADGFVARYSGVIGLEPDRETLDSGPTTLGWFSDKDRQSEGLRVVMIASPGAVGNVVVMNDLGE